MSVGGNVTRITVARVGILRVHTKEHLYPRDDETCICVPDTPQTRCIEPGDSIWWQGRKCYWTHSGGGSEDVEIERIGYSHEAPEVSQMKNLFSDGRRR